MDEMGRLRENAARGTARKLASMDERLRRPQSMRDDECSVQGQESFRSQIDALKADRDRYAAAQLERDRAETRAVKGGKSPI